jgi:hypothetical protein
MNFINPALDRLENEIMVCGAGTAIGEERGELLRALVNKNVDWAYLIKLVQKHGLMPLLYRNIDIFCREKVPPEILQDLKNQFEANEQKNILLAGEMIKIVHVLESNGIPAMPFKGPALAFSAYGNLAFRQFTDLDILVRSGNVLKTGELLGTLGYRTEFQLEQSHTADLLKYQYEYPFIHKSNRIFVEIQWELAPRYLNCPQLLEQFWRHYEPPSGESFLPTFPPEYLLLMLCIHGTKDFWRQMIWICDVAELIRASKDMDWPFVIEAGHSFGCGRMLFLGLFLARHILGTHLPDGVLQEIEADPATRKLALRVLKRLFQEDDEMPGFREYFFYLLSKERLRDKMRFVFSLITTISPEDWTFLDLPPFLYFLYYFVRPVRLAARYVFKMQR